MTRTLLIFGAVVLLAHGASAQNPLQDYVVETRGDTLVIADFYDAGAAGTLAAVIQADTDRGNVPAGRVYMLKSGSNGDLESGNLPLYLFSGDVTAQGRPLTIVGESCGLVVQGSDPNCRPPTIAGYLNANEAPTFAIFRIDDDLTFKNLHFTSAHTTGESNWSMVEIDGNNVELRWENVIAEHNRWTFTNSNGNVGTSLYISDSYFVNATDQPSRRNGGIYDTDQPMDVVEVENSTHVQMAGMQYKFRSFTPSRAVFNHNTFVNAAGQLFLGFGYMTNFAVTNNLFVNSNYQPYYPGLDQGEIYPADTPTAAFQPHGIINLSPLNGGTVVTSASYPESVAFAERDRKVLVDLNAAYWDDRLLGIAADLNAAGLEGNICSGDGCVEGDASLNWMNGAILANDRTVGMFNDDATYPLLTWGEWYSAGAPGFVDGPGMLDELYEWGYASASSNITTEDLLPKLRTAGNEAGQEIEDEDTNNWILFDWPIPIDLAYTNETYLSGGYNDFPLGDLNWFPAQKQSWTAQRDAEYAAIQQALDSGSRIGAGTSNAGGPSAISAVGQNQPNPFSGTTTFTFELASASDVTLEVFDALGRRVASIVDGTLPAGPHAVQWDAGSLSSGVYVYTLRAGDTVESRRMVVTR